MNADDAESDLAKQAAAERWSLEEFLRELRRQFPETAPAPLPPGPTDAIPGTLEKRTTMKRRVEQGFQACHPRDPRIENGFVVLESSVNENGGDTELEGRSEVEVRAEIDRRRRGWRTDHADMDRRLDRIANLLNRVKTRRGNG